jgi:sec-independent protein translocase protein TatA
VPFGIDALPFCLRANHLRGPRGERPIIWERNESARDAPTPVAKITAIFIVRPTILPLPRATIRGPGGRTQSLLSSRRQKLTPLTENACIAWALAPCPLAAGADAARLPRFAPARVRRRQGAAGSLGGFMGSFSIWHWMVVLLVVLLLFGGNKVSGLMGDFAKGIKAFKKNMSEGDDASMEASADKPTGTISGPGAQASTTNREQTAAH